MKKAVFIFSCIILLNCGKSEVLPKKIIDEAEVSLQHVSENSPGVGTWVPREALKSRNGESMGYGVFLNPNSTKLIIFLDGGGACFNGLTCGVNSNSYTESDFITRLANENSLLVDRVSDNNQFKDWNFVFVPYATGDVHSGNNPSADIGNGGPINQTMVGSNNVTIILNDLKTYFDQQNNTLSEVVLAGSSAGGFGVYVNYPKVKNTLAANITTTAIIDAGQIFMDESLLTSCLVDQWESSWRLDSAIPTDLNSFVQNEYEHNIQKIYEYLATKYPEDNFGFLSYKEDTTNSFFYGFGQNNCNYPPLGPVSANLFSEGLSDLKSSVLDNYENWKVFYKNGNSHTFLSDSNFSQTVNGTTLNDWIMQLRQGNAENLVE